MKSDGDLHVTYVDGVNGVSTTSGRIELEVAPNATLYYGDIFAGGDRDVILTADNLEKSAGRTYEVTEIQAVERYYQYPVYSWGWYDQVVTKVVYLPFSNPYYYDVLERSYGMFGSIINVPYYEYSSVLVTKTQPAGGQVATGGNVYLSHVTGDRGIEVGKSSASSGHLSLTEEILNSIAADAQSLIIGQHESAAYLTGKVELDNFHFDKGIIVQGSEIEATGLGLAAQLSSDAALELVAYNGLGSGKITLQNNSNVTAASVLATAYGDVDVKTVVTSDQANGLIALTAGKGAPSNSGSVNIDSTASIVASQAGADIVLKSGLTSGDLVIDGNVTANDSISLQARGGQVRQDSTTRLTAVDLELYAKATSVLYTNVDRITNAQVLGGDPSLHQQLIINELDALVLSDAQTDAGDIYVNTGGSLQVGELDATSAHNVVINASGDVIGMNVSPDLNIISDALWVSSDGGTALTTGVNSVNVITTDVGDVSIDNDGGALSALNANVQTFDGAITVSTEGDLTAGQVVSQTSNADNGISLSTRELFGGDVVVDRVDAGSQGSVEIRAGSTTGNTAGGTIRSLGSNRIIANELTAIAGGW
ncbi:MAG: hypothetical protein AAF226_12935, partial [Verrucomicrobiota bacterium]